jgi:amino acid transporter
MMNQTPTHEKHVSSYAYLTTTGAWALAFGCSVGWGSFVMPGNTFLPIAGPIGTALGLGAGALVMLILGVNFHHLMNQFPDGGGTYTYTRKCFGYDHGFLAAWFLILTYIAIIWANATALPLIARTVLGDTFQFGFHYEVAGFHVFFGEILLACAALLIAAMICLNRNAAQGTQIIMAVLLFAGVLICFFGAAILRNGDIPAFTPAFSPANSALKGTITIFALAPWAYVGFESITHSAAEARFPLKRSFGIMTAALIAAAMAYAFLGLLAVMVLPEGCSSWTDYIGNLGAFEGFAGLPTFFAAHSTMGTAGVVILGLAALGGIFPA